MSKKFQKKTENFVCEKCGQNVIGNGYTNHCPTCLWSKHVDKNPGDREEVCGGLMKPINFFKQKDEYVITGQCTICGFEKNNKLSKLDNFDQALKILKK